MFDIDENCFLLGCTEDGQCTDDDEKNACDITRNVCVGKFRKVGG